MKKKKLAVLFGGRSVEHEISVITALQLINVIDVTQYEIIPVYIAQTGRWYVGDNLLDKNFYPLRVVRDSPTSTLGITTFYLSTSISSPSTALLARMGAFRGCWRWQTQLILAVVFWLPRWE
jgi:D-alanine-D-alanine ligase-like ATP-grasp enzyme